MPLVYCRIYCTGNVSVLRYIGLKGKLHDLDIDGKDVQCYVYWTVRHLDS